MTFERRAVFCSLVSQMGSINTLASKYARKRTYLRTGQAGKDPG
jgi:hypothetical protein